MGDAWFDAMVDEAGLSIDEFADVSVMLAELQQAGDALSAPSPGPELAKLLAAAPVRRMARRRRAAGAAGATVLALGSLGGAAAAHVLPEPIQEFVTQLPGPVGDSEPEPAPGPGDRVTPEPLEREPVRPETPAGSMPPATVPPSGGGPHEAPGRSKRPPRVPVGPPASVPADLPTHAAPNGLPDVPRGDVPPVDLPDVVPTPREGGAKGNLPRERVPGRGEAPRSRGGQPGAR